MFAIIMVKDSAPATRTINASTTIMILASPSQTLTRGTVRIAFSRTLIVIPIGTIVRALADERPDEVARRQIGEVVFFYEKAALRSFPK